MEAPVMLISSPSVKDSLECVLMDFGVIDDSLQVQLKFSSQKNHPSELFQDLLLCKNLLKVGIIGLLTERRISSSCVTCHKVCEEKGKQISVVLDIGSAEYKCPGSCGGDDRTSLKPEIKEKELKPLSITEKQPSEFNSATSISKVESPPKAESLLKVKSSTSEAECSTSTTRSSLRRVESSSSKDKVSSSSNDSSSSKCKSSSKTETSSLKEKSSLSKSEVSSSRAKSTPSKSESMLSTSDLSSSKANSSARRSSRLQARASDVNKKTISEKTKKVKNRHGNKVAVEDKSFDDDTSSHQELQVDEDPSEDTDKAEDSEDERQIHENPDDEEPIDEDPDDEEIYQCDLCDESFTSKRNFQNHKKEHGIKSNTKTSSSNGQSKKTHKFTCRLCGKGFVKSRLLSRHILTHTVEYKFSCPHCGKRFSLEGYLKKHLKRHKEAEIKESKAENPRNYRLKCKLCDEKFSHLLLLSTHMKSHTSERIYSCKECNISFTDEAQSKLHLEVHPTGMIESDSVGVIKSEPIERPGYDCPVCGMNHITRAHLRKHMEDHTEEEKKNVPISILESPGRPGKRKKNRRGEERKETKKMKSKEKGSRSAADSSSNAEGDKSDGDELEDGETLSGGRNTCKLCNKSFRSYWHIKKHLRTHGDKPFKCKICDASFQKLTEYLNHVKIHNCSLCSLKFPTPELLEAHVTSHKISCKSCQKVFALSDLKEHMKSHDAEKSKSDTGKSKTETDKDISDTGKSKQEAEKNAAVADNQTEGENVDGGTLNNAENEIASENDDSTEKRLCVKSGPQYECRICSKMFCRPALLANHMEAHMSQNKYECYRCDKTFTVEGYLRKHLKRHAERDKKEAENGGDVKPPIVFPQRKPKAPIEKKEYHCKFCNTKFNQKSGLFTHNRRVHSVKDATSSFQCHVCGEVFSCQKNVDKHVESNCKFSETHKQKCQECGKMLANSVALEQHMKHHNASERTHMCEVCGKCFLKKSSLRAHMFSHNGQRAHACDICGRKYQHVWHLKNHRKIHTGEDLHQCPFCDDWFVNLSYLNNQHRRKYCRGKKTIHCDRCDFAFYDHKELERHNRYHLGEFHWMCDKCGASFPMKANLEDHRKRHILGGKFQCSYCDRLFKHKKDWRRHEDRHNSENGLGRMILSMEKKPKKEPVEFETEEIQQATIVIADSNSGSQFVSEESVLSVESGHTYVVQSEDIMTTEALSTFSNDQVTTQSIIVLPPGMSGGQNINITEDGQVLMVAMDPESKIQ